MTESKDYLYPLVFLLILIILYILLIFIFKGLIPYLKQRKYIKGEMERSFSEREYKYWKRKLKILYLDFIPFIGNVIKRHLK